MYRNTRFSQLMEHFPRGLFDQKVREYKTDRYAKNFSSWDQVVAMIYLQLSEQKSLRDLEQAFNAQSHVHYHLGTRKLKRATLADANKRIDSRLYQSICEALLKNVKGKHRKPIETALYLLDSTPIQLKGLGYDDWTKEHRASRTQGLKAHVLYDQKREVPAYTTITPPNVNDIEEGRKIPIEPGATYVFDKGYCDYNWWYEIACQGACFVTRYKANASLVSLSRTVNSDPDSPVLCDETVRFRNRRPGGHRINHYRAPLRRITVDRPDEKSPLILATNDMVRSAEEIAELYKARWQIELFFKWMKQNLKIKRFLARNENAVRSQLFIAIITFLLLYLYRARHGAQGSMKAFLVIFRTTMFSRPETDEAVYRRRREIREEIEKRQVQLWP